VLLWEQMLLHEQTLKINILQCFFAQTDHTCPFIKVTGITYDVFIVF